MIAWRLCLSIALYFFGTCGFSALSLAQVLNPEEVGDDLVQPLRLPAAVAALSQGVFHHSGFEFEPGTLKECSLRLNMAGQVKLWRCQVEGSYLLLTDTLGYGVTGAPVILALPPRLSPPRLTT